MSAPAGAVRATRVPACADPPLRARSPVGVPPRFSPGACSIPKGSASGQASWDVDGVFAPLIPHWGRMNPVATGVTRPALSQSSGSTPRTAPSGGQHDARSRPGADRNSARGHRTRPGLRVYLPKRPLRARFDLGNVSETVTNVNQSVTPSFRGRASARSPESIPPAPGLWIPDLPLRGNPE